MMLDTLKIADLLREAGFDERQARALADVQKQAVEEGGLATKSDIVRLDARMDALDARMGALETQLKMIFGILALLVALVGAIFIKIFLG